MSALRYKPGVVWTDLHPAVGIAIGVMLWLYNQRVPASDLVITATSNGRHREGSWHYTTPCRAVDIRTWNLPSTDAREWLLANARRVLVPLGFHVNYEATIKNAQGNITRGEHWHISYPGSGGDVGKRIG